jgi:tRNA1Val (adenine37-N6)-methyltransferase
MWYKDPGRAGTPDPGPPPGDYRQPEGGYRFSRDSVLLALFAPEELPGRAADLGAGCGVVGLEALARGRLKGLKALYLIEAAEVFREALMENAGKAASPSGPAITPLMADWRRLGPDDLGGPLDHLLVNPPYFPVGSSGPARPDRHRARHETHGDLGDLFGTARRLLRPGGGLSLSWPRARLAVLVETAAASGWAPVRLKLPPRPGNGLVLAELKA